MSLFLFPKKIAIIRSGGTDGLLMSNGTDTQTDTPSIRTTFDNGTDSQSASHSITTTLAQGTDTQTTALATASSTANTSTGTDTQTNNSQSITTALAQGTDTQTDTNSESLTTSTGTDTQTNNSQSITTTLVQGTDTQTDTNSINLNLSTGSDSASHSASALATISQFTNSASSTVNAGTQGWSSVNSITGNFDDVNSSWILVPGIVLTTGDATLKSLTGLTGPATPSGFTVSGYNIAINHKWNLNCALVDTASYALELRNSTGSTLLKTLVTRNQASADKTQNTLIKEYYTFTVGTSADVTDAQLAAGLQVWHQIQASLASNATSTTITGAVDAIHLRAAYTQTGIT